jgi:hypothetical protein
MATKLTESDFLLPEKVCILAPGPNGEDHWKDIDCYTIALNRAILIPVTKNAWLVADGFAVKTDWFKEGYQDYREELITIFGTSVLRNNPLDCDFKFSCVPRFEKGYRKHRDRFRPDESVVGIAIDLAERRGAKEIVLCGVDMSGDTYWDGVAALCSSEYTRGDDWSQRPALNELINWHIEHGIKITSLSETALDCIA